MATAKFKIKVNNYNTINIAEASRLFNLSEPVIRLILAKREAAVISLPEFCQLVFIHIQAQSDYFVTKVSSKWSSDLKKLHQYFLTNNLVERTGNNAYVHLRRVSDVINIDKSILNKIITISSVHSIAAKRQACLYNATQLLYAIFDCLDSMPAEERDNIAKGFDEHVSIAYAFYKQAMQCISLKN